MKTMTCKQLGGACDQAFHASSFDEIAGMSRNHAMEMFKQQDAAHLQAMQEMQALMQSPQAMADWMEARKKEFDSLPDHP